MSPLEIVREYFQAWVNADQGRLHLHPEFRHESPNGVFEGRDAFLEACWAGNTGGKLHLEAELTQGNQVVVRHTIPTPLGPFPVCEWFTVEHGLITECRAYYDRRFGEGDETTTTA